MSGPGPRDTTRDDPVAGEIYIEYRLIGGQQRADAIDPVTGIEVTVFGPAKVPRDELGRLAVRKLMRRLEGEKAEDEPKTESGRYV